jgi:hypothetical protein
MMAASKIAADRSRILNLHRDRDILLNCERAGDLKRVGYDREKDLKCFPR